MLALNPKRLIFVPDAQAASRLELAPGDNLAWWGREAPRDVIDLAQKCGAGTVRIEDGFVRSVGLGSDLIAPLSLVLDKQGIYFEDRKSVVSGKRVSVRVDLGGRRVIEKNNRDTQAQAYV